jgi:hypothetical protein
VGAQLFLLLPSPSPSFSSSSSPMYEICMGGFHGIHVGSTSPHVGFAPSFR